jgi:hypothetical protein
LRGKIGALEYPIQVAALTAILIVFSRRAIDFRIRNAFGSILLGIVVFLLWIGPDALIPGWRSHWLFSNDLVGVPGSTIAPGWRNDVSVLIFRTIKAAVLVAIIEELFWRSFLMRWLIKPDFERVGPGTYNFQAFWIVAALFALEHGSYWEVGLIAGALYGWWMVHTKSLGDAILAHGVTNLILCVYAIRYGQWQYLG